MIPWLGVDYRKRVFTGLLKITKMIIVKKTFIVAMLLIIGTFAHAQVSVGAGYVNAVYTNGVYFNNVASDRVYNGFYAGIGYSFPLVAGVSLTPGVYFESISSSLVTDLSAFTTYSDCSQRFLNIPLNFSYDINISPGFCILVYAGPTASLGLSSVDKSYTHFEFEDYDSEEIVTRSFDNGDLKRFDVKVGGGLGIKVMNHVCITVGYNWGLLDPRNYKLEKEPFKRNQLVAGVSYLF